MIRTKLSDKQLISISLIAIIGYFILANMFAEQPSDSQNVNTSLISKQAASQMAQQFILDRFQADVEQIDILYDTYKSFEGYLQKNGWMNDYVKLYGEDFPLNYYLAEASGEQRFQVYMNTSNGNVFAWKRYGNDLKDDAERLHLAEQFLTEQGFNIAEWERDPSSSNPYMFVSSQQHQTFGEAKRRIQIEVADDGNISAYRSDFIIPEEHGVWVMQQDRFAAQMSSVYLISSFLFFIAAIIIVVILRKRLSFGRGVWLAIFFLLTNAIHQVNMLPSYRILMSSESDSQIGAIAYLIFMQLYTLATAVLVYFTLVAGDGLWRKMGRNVWARLQEETSKHSILKAMGRGYLFSLIIIGLQQIFYLIAQRQFGVWTVDDPIFSMHNLLWPFLYPLLAWAAAISEEAIFRLFGIAVFKKLLRNTFVAALVSSMIWAIGHMTYPIYPVYTRFIEVTLLGLLFAFILLQYGWVTAVFAHASVNSILTGIGLIVEYSGTTRWIALLYICSPAIIACIIYMFRKNKSSVQPSLR